MADNKLQASCDHQIGEQVPVQPGKVIIKKAAALDTLFFQTRLLLVPTQPSPFINREENRRRPLPRDAEVKALPQEARHVTIILHSSYWRTKAGWNG